MALSGMDNAQFGCPLRTPNPARPHGTTAGLEPGVVVVRAIGRGLEEAPLLVLRCLPDVVHRDGVERNLGLLLFQHGYLDTI